MQCSHVLRRFSGLLLTVACATGGSGVSFAAAATVPPPPKPPHETLIEPGDGLTRTKYGQAKEHVHQLKQSTEHATHEKPDQQSPHDQ